MRISDWSSDVCSSDLSPRRHQLAKFATHFVCSRVIVAKLGVEGLVRLERPQEHVHHHLVLHREWTDRHSDLTRQILDDDRVYPFFEQSVPLVGEDAVDA